MKTRYFKFLILVPALSGLAGCASVRLDTPEPVKIDVNMKVDVYNHDAPDKKPKGESAPGSGADKTPELRRKERMAEVQSLKNDHIVGEGKDGLLSVVKPPAEASYKDYAQKIVDEDNADRKQIFEADAAASKKPVTAITADFARRAREGSYPGEWIQKDDGTWVTR